MKKSNEELFLKLELEGIFDKNKTLYLLDLPSQHQLKSIGRICKNNEVYVFARGYNDEIKIGTSFNFLFPKKQIDEFVQITVELKYVSVNPKYEIDYLPKGYSAICLLAFSDDLPIKLLDKLAMFDDKKDPSLHDTLILTQSDVLKELLDEEKL